MQVWIYSVQLGFAGELTVSRTLRSIQNFLGRGLNYYSKFIGDFAVHDSVINELQEVKFHEISRASDVSVSVPDA